MPSRIETDYLVVGAGAAGMAFTDALVDASGASVVVVDRRHAPGGHWHEAYPFVRLHQPSSYYGVNSVVLGTDAIDRRGPNAGMYERASAAEICAYYDRVKAKLEGSGQVRFVPMSSYVGDHRIVSHLAGVKGEPETIEVTVRKKVVDTTYLEAAVPASSPPPFSVVDGARCVPVGALASLVTRHERPEGFVIIGAGKTALDACTWLLESGVDPARIRWVKPRDGWYFNRAFAQGGDLVATMLEGIVLQLEAAASATSTTDLFERLEASKQLLRVDPKVAPTMYRGATIGAAEVEQLRRIEDVVRLGRVRRIERERIVLDGGSIPTSMRHLHVHCASSGLSGAPAVPIFAPDRIVLQSIRIGLLPFAAAMIGFVEATRHDLADKNRLCPPNPQPNVPLDWIRGTLVGMKADHAWSKEPDIVDWLERSRLNPARGLRRREDEPRRQAVWQRYLASVRPAVANLERFLATG